MVYLLVKHWIKYGTIIEIFGDFPSKDFPLMAKIVDAAAPLSIHVHPTILMHMNTKKVNMENLNVGTSLKLMKVQRLL